MDFTIEVDITKEPEKYQKYYDAFVNNKLLTTGSRVVEMGYYVSDTYHGVLCIFRLRR